MTIARGEPMLASDILDMVFFPVGAILMMDGSWTDGRGGWYICDGREKTLPNGSKVKMPDLQDKFVKGAGSLPKEGGSNSASVSLTLTADNLPSHSHDFSGTFTTRNTSVVHTHTVTATGTISGGDHSHSITDKSHSHTITTTGRHGQKDNAGNPTAAWDYGDVYHSGTASKTSSSVGTGITGTQSSGHSHTFSGTSATTTNSTDTGHAHQVTLSGNTGTAGSSVPAALNMNTIPAYYAVIYIKKMV
jgi:hypothetical protein